MLPDQRLKAILDAGYDGWIEVESAGVAIYEAGYLNVLKANRRFLNAFHRARLANVTSKSA